VGLFPLALGIIDPGSPHLVPILNYIISKEHLWTEYGILSLSKNDTYFGTGENYWKGPIWININYLILASLYRNYIFTKGPHQELSKRVYSDLRRAIVNTITRGYEQQGYIFEQYNPINGRGQRSHPFTGWSSLVVAIMSEKY